VISMAIQETFETERRTGRVVVITNTNQGGRWIVPIVRKLVNSGSEVCCIVASEVGDLAELLSDAGASVHRLSFGRGGIKSLWQTLRGLHRIFRDFGPDTVIYYLYKASLFVRLASLFEKRATFVHVVVGPIFLEVPPLRLLERVLMRRDDHIVAGSQAIRVMYSAIGRNDNISVVYPPIDFERMRPPSPLERLESRSALGVDEHEFVVVMVSYWYAPKWPISGEPHLKGHDVALRAWRAYRDGGGAGKLVIVGGGFREVGVAYRKKFLEEFRALIDDSVLVVDRVDDVRPYYRAASVSIAPSTTENLGSSAEAAAMGVPSIASMVGGIPEVVVDGYSGWLIPKGDVRAVTRAIHEAADAFAEGSLSLRGELGHGLARALLERRAVEARFLAVLLDLDK